MRRQKAEAEKQCESLTRELELVRESAEQQKLAGIAEVRAVSSSVLLSFFFVFCFTRDKMFIYKFRLIFYLSDATTCNRLPT